MNFRVLLNRGPTSTQLISASTDFFATPSTLLEPKYHISLHNFWKCRWKNSKLSVLPENRHTDYGEDFTWKLPQRERVSWGCWFLFCDYFSEIPNLYQVLGKFESKKVNSPLRLEAGTQSVLKIWLWGYRGTFGSKSKDE